MVKMRPDVRYELNKDMQKAEFIGNIFSLFSMIKSGLSSLVSKEPLVDKEEVVDDDDQNKNKQTTGADRANKYSSGCPTDRLDEAINKFAPDAQAVQSGQKIIYTNDQTGVQVVYDEAGNYFRIQNTNLPGRRTYLDLNGTVPNNNIINRRSVGKTQAEYNQATHFNNSDQ